ncbi:hypothetical protein AYI69_g7227, partial [Smittium culicis]
MIRFKSTRVWFAILVYLTQRTSSSYWDSVY